MLNKSEGEEEREREKWNRGGLVGMTGAVIYNNCIKQIRANQPAHEYIMLPQLIYDYNVRV